MVNSDRRRLRATRHAGGRVLPRLLLHVELDPLAPIGVDRSRDHLVLREVPQPESLAGLEDHPGRAHELRHDDALGAVDHERALVGHHGEVAHEDRLLFDLAGRRVDESGPNEDRGRVGHVLLFALLHGELRVGLEVLVVRIELQLELEGFREVLDRADITEGIGQTLLQEPAEGIALDGDQVRKLEGLPEDCRRSSGRERQYVQARGTTR